MLENNVVSTENIVAHCNIELLAPAWRVVPVYSIVENLVLRARSEILGSAVG